MKRIRIYRNPECAKCARYARAHQMFDWLKRIKVTTANPPMGPLLPGEVVVERLATGEFLHGADALEEICRHVPLYRPLRFMLRISVLRGIADRALAGMKCQAQSGGDAGCRKC